MRKRDSSVCSLCAGTPACASAAMESAANRHLLPQAGGGASVAALAGAAEVALPPVESLHINLKGQRDEDGWLQMAAFFKHRLSALWIYHAPA